MVNGWNSVSALFKSCLVGTQNRFLIRVVTFNFLRFSREQKFIRFGSAYGGWHVASKLVETNGNKVLISAGLGHDVTFDIEMLKNGFKVIGLDPLESSYDYAREALANFGSNADLLNVGLWKVSGRVDFYSPKVLNHDSWSILNAHETQGVSCVTFPVVDLNFLAESRPYLAESSVRILKMDIEGAEAEMFDVISNFTPKFDQISIEMDFLSLIKFKQINRRLKETRRARKVLRIMQMRGYDLVNHENFNFTWLLRA
jgi:FkbM family methyltransferase